MNILLCMPRVSYSTNEWPSPPIGIQYVSSSLKEAGYNVYTLSLISEKRTEYEALKQMIEDYDIDMIGCGDLVVNLKDVKQVIDAAKEIKPDIITVIGGSLVTFSAIEAMELIPTADYGVIGEGEITMRRLIDALTQGSDIANVDNIIFRRTDEQGGNEYIITKDGGDIPNLDKLPMPDYDSFVADVLHRTKSAAIVTSRSCPYNCTFCCHSGGKKYRQRSMDSVFEEIDYLVQKYDIRRIFINDELFSVNTDRLIEFCKRIKKYELKWFVCLRLSSSLTTEILTLMKASGCDTVFLGLESADDTILKSMNKGTSVELMETVLERISSVGLKAGGNFIFGDAEETIDSVNNTISWVRRNCDKIARFAFAPIVLYPGSQLYANAVKDKKIDPLEHIRNGCPLVNVSKMTDEQYNEMAKSTLMREYSSIMSVKQKGSVRFEVGSGKDGYRLEIVCPECSSHNFIEIETSSIANTSLDYVCGTCSNNYFTYLLGEYTKWIDEKLGRLIRKYKCAFWPSGMDYSVINQSSQELKNPDADHSLININPGLQKKSFCSREVFAPSVLLESDKIDTVVICAYYEVIANTLSLNYPHIRQIAFRDIGLLDI